MQDVAEALKIFSLFACVFLIRWHVFCRSALSSHCHSKIHKHTSPPSLVIAPVPLFLCLHEDGLISSNSLRCCHLASRAIFNFNSENKQQFHPIIYPSHCAGVFADDREVWCSGTVLGWAPQCGGALVDGWDLYWAHCTEKVDEWQLFSAVCRNVCVCICVYACVWVLYVGMWGGGSNRWRPRHKCVAFATHSFAVCCCACLKMH